MGCRAMPELPEVEIARRSLVRWLDGRRVVRAIPDETARTFRGADPSMFTKLTGALEGTERRGKYLLAAFSDGYGALWHLGMTGKLVRRPQGHEERWSRARLELDDGCAVHFRDPRLFGRIEPVKGGLEVLRALPPFVELGVDPLVDGLTAASLEEAVGRSKQDLKVALMDQGRIAGLGNIHAAEALFRAGVHPERKAQSLGKAEWTKLARAIRDSIAFALADAEGQDEIEYVEEPGAQNPFHIYGRAGEPCRRCKTKVRSLIQGGRTTHYCPTCQPKRPKR